MQRLQPPSFSITAHVKCSPTLSFRAGHCGGNLYITQLPPCELPLTQLIQLLLVADILLSPVGRWRLFCCGNLLGYGKSCIRVLWVCRWVVRRGVAKNFVNDCLMCGSRSSCLLRRGLRRRGCGTCRLCWGNGSAPLFAASLFFPTIIALHKVWFLFTPTFRAYLGV